MPKEPCHAVLLFLVWLPEDVDYPCQCEQNKRMNYFHQTHRKRHSLKEDFFFPEEQSPLPDRAFISPWISKKSAREKTKTTDESTKTIEFLSKLQLRSAKAKEEKLEVKEPVSETTLIAYPKKAMVYETLKDESCFSERRRSNRVLKLKRITLDNIQSVDHDHPVELIVPKSYNLSLFQMKWRTRELKKQRIKRQHRPEDQPVALNDYFFKMHFNQGIKHDQFLRKIESNDPSTQSLFRMTRGMGKTLSSFK